MKRFTTIVACIAFAIFGIGLARYSEEKGVGPPGHALTANAQEMFEWTLPQTANVQTLTPHSFEEKEQLQSYVESSAATNSDSILIDSLRDENSKLTAKICSLQEQEKAYKAEGRGSPAPNSVGKVRTIIKTKTVRDTITVRDTVKEPVYITTQVGMEDPDGCVSVYELKHVRNICPETSSEGDVIAHPNSTDE